MTKKTCETNPDSAGTQKLLEPRRGFTCGRMLHTKFRGSRCRLRTENETFWYKVLDQYNEEAKINKFLIRTKNMLMGKWTSMNREVGRFNSLVNETKILSGENDDDWMAKVEIFYKSVAV
nr:hypothetical protein [Tanacetum cinerariifolium]